MRRILALAAMLIIASALAASIRVLERSAEHLVIQYLLEDYSLTRQDDLIRIEAGNMDHPMRSGAPLLPFAETRIGVPPAGGIEVTLLSSSSHEERIEKRLLPVPEVFMNDGVSEHGYEIDENLYGSTGAPLLNVLAASSFRGFGFVPLEIHPFSYDGRNSLVVTDQAVIRIDITGDSRFKNEDLAGQADEIFLSNLLNADQTRFWRDTQRYEVNYADFSRSDFWLRLETDREGMYRITPPQLDGFPLADIDPRSFRLFSTGGILLPFTITNPGYEFTEIPIHVEGESDGSFDPGDHIAFFGTTRDGVDKNQNLQNSDTYFNPYSGNTVYWLTFAGDFDGEPLRMQTLPAQTTWDNQTSAFTGEARLETESQRREIIGFDWYTARMFGNSTADYEFELELDDLDASQPQELSMMIRQEDVNHVIWHNINVYVNDIPVVADTTSGSTTFSWSGDNWYSFYQKVNSFVSGTNTIRIRVNRSGTDNLFLNWITVGHSRRIIKGAGQNIVNQLEMNYDVPVRYDLTGASDTMIHRVNGFSEADMVPVQTSGGQAYFVSAGTAGTRFVMSDAAEFYSPVNISQLQPVDLTLNPIQIDNVIISADEYADQAQALADMYWQEFGKRSRVVRQSDVFNQFNGGHPDPAAIRQFLRWAWQEYPAPHLASATLIGLGTIDWRNFSGQASGKNKLIVFQRNNTIVSDDYFVMLTQASHPELAVGRYPVSSETELNNMLSNFQNYTQNMEGGWWRNSMVFLGDDLFNGSSSAYENIHTRQTQEAEEVVHPSVLVDKIFAWEYEYDEFQNKPEARDDMMSAINDGRLVWYYIGHGSFDKLGAEDYFNGASDMGRFDNPNKLTFFMAASCKVSHFDYWGFESLGQKTVLLNNLGAIASYSATRVSTPYNNAPMMELVLEGLANGRNPVGYAIMRAKTLYTQSNDNDATYVLLGDPLLPITPPVRDSVMDLSGTSGKARDETLHARQLATITGGFDPSSLDGVCDVRVYNTETEYDLDWQTHVSHRGAPLFKGSASVEGGQYSSEFIVPDDVVTGNTGLIVSYVWDPASRQDHVNFLHPLALSDEAVIAENPDVPDIEIYLGSMDFRPGDTVGANPVLYARISDSNGVNVTGGSGHNILLILDNSLQPLPVTEYFSYDLDSHTQGLLTYPLANLEEGAHTLQLIAFDNFNMPSVATTDFVVKKTGELAIERFLIYPNPMQNETSFTFMLSQDCELSIDIFSMSGKKIHSIAALGKQGFNQVPWNGRDRMGDKLANNTYFVKVRARSEGLKAEKTEKLVIYN